MHGHAASCPLFDWSGASFRLNSISSPPAGHRRLARTRRRLLFIHVVVKDSETRRGLRRRRAGLFDSVSIMNLRVHYYPSRPSVLEIPSGTESSPMAARPSGNKVCGSTYIYWIAVSSFFQNQANRPQVCLKIPLRGASTTGSTASG